MRTVILYASMLVMGYITACKTVPEGMSEVKSPFSGSKYESNRRWFRATASGESMNLETSKDKALLSAKQRLAGQIQTQVKNVAESYKGERQADNTLDEYNERFQQMTREVMNQVLVEAQIMETKTYVTKDKRYTTFVALEARKRIVYRRLKDVAKSKTSLSEADKKYISEMMDKAIKDLEDED
jgi:hypothetical protein